MASDKVKGLRERLRDNESVICAEGYLWELEKRGFVKLGDYTPEVVLDHPERVRALSEEFVWAGSDVVEAFTYYAHRQKMESIGRGGDLEKLNTQALDIAKDVATQYGCLMAGGLSNTNVYDEASQQAMEQTEAMFKEQIEWAVERGADYIIGETFPELGEALLALKCIQKYGNGLPSVITLTMYKEHHTVDNVPTTEALLRLEGEGADVVGLNCGLGPENMVPLLDRARKVCKGPLAALPVPIRVSDTVRVMHSARDPRDGSPLYPTDLDCVQCKRSEIRNFAEQVRKIGVQYVGLCCGAVPSLIREVAMAYGRTPRAARFAPDVSRNIYKLNGIQELTGKAKLYSEALYFGPNAQQEN